MAPALHLILRDVEGVPEALAHDLERAYHGSAAFHLGALRDVAYLEETLGSAGVPWLVLKGPVLGALYYESPDVRPYSDLDVLVGGSAFGDAVAALEAAGCRVGQEWPAVAGDPPGEMQLVLPSGRALDLHWDLVNSPTVRRRFSAATAPLFARARPVTLGGTAVMTLGPADTLAHLLLHGWLSGGDRLVWMKDVVLGVEREGVEAVEEARAVSGSWKTGLVADAYLERVRATSGDSGPTCLAPARRWWSPWLGVVRLADRVATVTDREGGPSLARVLARSTRRDDIASCAEVARKAWVHLGERLPPTGRRVAGRRLAAGHPARRLPEAPVAERRRAFLRAVERAGAAPAGDQRGT